MEAESLYINHEDKMNYSVVISEELKGLDSRQLKAIYRFIKSFKKEKAKQEEEISLAEIWRITANAPGNWSSELEEMREERL